MSTLERADARAGVALPIGPRTAAVLALASVAGYVLLDGSPPTTIAFVLAFAGGAILTMLADTMMPEAYEHGGTVVGVATTLGFALHRLNLVRVRVG